MEEAAYATQPDRPMSQLDTLFGELAHVHDLISTLEGRLSPVIHHGLKDNSAKLATQAGSPAAQNHISTAVEATAAAARRLREVIDSLAV